MSGSYVCSSGVELFMIALAHLCILFFTARKTKFAKVIFLHVCVILSTGGGVCLVARRGVCSCSGWGVCGCSRGRVWLLWGACVVALGGVCMVAPRVGGRGACMLAPRGCMVCSRGRGMRGCSRGGACMGYDEIRRCYQ